MRFAYIDSQGNEVPIPGVDALALRIELGAIGPETQLYDAQADRWGAAKSHEIFHTLSREAGDDGGFVAPPPPVSASSSPPSEEVEAESTDALDPAEEEGASEGAGEGDEMPEDAGFADDLQLTLTEEEPAGEMGLGSMDLELTEESTAPESPPSLEPPPPSDPPVEDPEPARELEQNDAAFDFGGMDHLELEEEDDPETGTGTSQEPDPVPGTGYDTGPEVGFGDGMELEEPLGGQGGAGDAGAMDFGGDIEFEEPLSAQGGDADFRGVGFGEDMELEQPMSEYSAASPPAWMEQDGPGEFRMDDDVGESGPDPASDDPEAAAAGGMAAGLEPEEPAEENARPPAPSREARSRPSPPRRPKQSSLPTVVLMVLGLGIVGGAGWFGWRALQGGGVGGDELPPVTVPDIPAELLPTMRDVGEVALGNTMDELAAMQEEAELPAAPQGDWLAGVYLANAGDFADVQAYWVGISDFVDRVRSSDTRIFHEEYEEALAAREITGDRARILLERADSGFLATRNERNRVYERMEELVDASLDLHGFLLENQNDIDYEPAAGGFSSDPVVEAVPASDELGDEMWGRVDRITAALDQLGTLDRVTTERLLAVLFEGIRSAGFQ